MLLYSIQYYYLQYGGPNSPRKNFESVQIPGYFILMISQCNQIWLVLIYSNIKHLIVALNFARVFTF